MKKIIATLAAAAAVALPALFVPSQADDSKLTKGYHTMDAMGCMLLRECTDGVKQINNLLDLSSEYPNTDEFTFVSDEFNRMLLALDRVGVKVFLAPSKYFPVSHRGVYHTVSNNFFLNEDYMGRPGTLMQVMRHEGWHAAQDCMAGTIKNSLVAIIKPEDEVPMIWRVMAERTYPEHAVPWEAEAGWAGRTEKMTMEALESCARGTMWTDYEPTPKTREWLEENGYLKKS
tara:strand:+ start:37 stop:729 length:693 start_codon:yes stop_codon:yes gene_type:complete